jgi:SnoaL-like domain
MYERRLELNAPVERIHDAIATVDGLRAWWTPIVTGSVAPGGELHFGFEDLDEEIVMHVHEPLGWTCLAHTGCPAWRGSRVTFTIVDGGLEFRHDGMERSLVVAGWERFLASLAALVEHGEGAPFGREAPAVALAYHRAWTARDFAAAARLLASDLETDVPLNRYAGKDEFVGALTGFAGLVHRVELLARFGRGDEALLLYDMETEPFGTIRIAEHFTVSGGLIARIRHVHDTAALRAAVA